MTADPFILRTAALCIVALCIGGVAVLVSREAEFRDRLRVWLVATPVVLVAAAVPHGFAAFAAVVAVVGGAELARLVGTRVRTRVAVLAAALVPVAVVVSAEVAVPGSRLVPVLWGVTLLLLLPAGVWLLPAVRDGRTGPGVVAALGLVGMPLVVLATADPRVVLATLVAVSLGDVAGFVGGHAARPLRGRAGLVARTLTRPLSPWSPNKTVAGGIASVVVGALVLVRLGPPSPGGWWLAALVPVWGVVGDLRESRVKRLAGVKDAGRWLPGFGGLLDRVDSSLGAMVGLVAVQAVVVAAPLVLTVTDLGGVPA